MIETGEQSTVLMDVCNVQCAMKKKSDYDDVCAAVVEDEKIGPPEEKNMM